jgi:hypothetical protein
MLPVIRPGQLQTPPAPDQTVPATDGQQSSDQSTRPPNVGDVAVAQTMNPPPDQTADAGAPTPPSPPAPTDDRTLVPSTSQTFKLLSPATNDPRDAALVDATNRWLQAGHKIEELSVDQQEALQHATTGSTEPSDDVVNSDPALFYQLKFKPGKYEPQLLDELGSPAGMARLNWGFLTSPFAMVSGLAKGAWDTITQDAARGDVVVPLGPFGIPLSPEGLAQRTAMMTKGISQTAANLAKIPFGVSDAAMDLAIRLQRPFADPARQEELDHEQSETIRRQTNVDNMAQNLVNNSKTMAGNVLKSVGLADFGAKVAAAPVTDQQTMLASIFTDPTTYMEFGAGAVEGKAAQVGTRFQQLEEATADAQKAGQAVSDLEVKRAAFQSVVDHPDATAGDVQAATKAMASFQPAEAQAAKNLSSAQAAQQTAQSAVNNDILAGAPQLSTARAVTSKLLQMGGQAADAVGKLAQWGAELPEKIGNKYLSWIPEQIRGRVVDGVIGHVVGVPEPVVLGPAIGGVVRKLTPQVLQSAGRTLAMVGEQAALGQQTLPLFQNLAEKSQGMTKTAFSYLNNPLVYAMPDTFRGAARGALIGGGQGYLASGGQAQPTVQGAGQGGFLGAVGSGLGQINKFNSPAELHIASIGDRARFVKTLSPDSYNNFVKADPQTQLGIASHALAHPDMQVSFFNDPTNTSYNGHHQVIDTPNGPRSAVSINASGTNPMLPILIHEAGHHIAANGLSGEVYNRILGDTVSGTPGLFAKYGDDGKPLMQPDRNGVMRYVPNDDFETYKANYNSKLPAGHPPENDAGIAQELFSDLHASALADPRAVQKLVRGYLPDNLLGQNVMDHFFSKVGVPIDANTGRPAVTDTVAKTKGLNDLIIEYYRQRQSRLQKADDETGLPRVPIATVRKGTPEFDRLSTQLNATGDIKRNPDGTIWTDMAGRPQVLPEKTADALHGALTDHTIKLLSGMPGDAPGEPNPIQLTTDRGGKQAYVGPHAPERLFDELARTNQYNANQILQLRQLNGAMKREDGTLFTTIYNTAGKRGRYATLPARERAIVPVVHEISPTNRQWNIGAYDPEQLQENMVKSFRNPKVKALWDSKIDAMHSDVATYLGNLVKGQPGETGIGIPKKGVINQFFGFDQGAHPTIGQLTVKNPSVFKSFRVDRMNQVRELPGQTQPFRPGTYEQIHGFMQPRGMGAEPAGGSFQPRGMGAEPAQEDAIPVTMRTTRSGKQEPVTIDYDLSHTPLVADKAPPDKLGAGADNSFGHVKFLTEPEQQKLTHLDNASAVTDYANKLVDEFGKWKDDPRVMAAKTWYGDVLKHLTKGFKGDKQLFAELLSATSPQNGVVQNFKDALEAYKQYRSGAYDAQIRNWKSQGYGKITEDLKPVKSNGAKFGMNSDAVLRVLSDKWLQNVKGPKTPNFFANLFRKGTDATIDMWAARTMHRLGHEGVEGAPEQWRIQPKSEEGVSDLDFALSQQAFKQAADKLGMKPHQLQAILWYGEKVHYANKNYTKGGASAALASFIPQLKAYAAAPELAPTTADTRRVSIAK